MSQAASSHYVNLIAKDGLTAVFRTAGQSAQASATQISTAGKTAAAGVTQVDAAAIKAKGSIAGLGTQVTKFKAESAAAGVAIASIVGFLSDAARAAAEEQAGLDRLEQAVTNTGASYDQYAESIDAAVAASQRLSFADDQAVDALNTLTAATQDTERALELLGIAEDLARGKGISLATSSEIIGKVAAGNLGILSRYGIVLDENATSTEALAEIQDRFAGQSERFAESQAGFAARTKNDFDNLVESIGANTGELQGLLTLLPGATAGFQLLGGAIGGLGKAGAAGIKGLAGSVAGLVTALNPLTIGLGAVAVAAGVVIKAWADNEAANESLAESYDALTGAIRETQTAQQQIASESIRFDFPIADQIEALGGAVEDQVMGTDFVEYQKMLDRMTLSTEEQAKANQLLADAFREVATGDIDALIAAMDKLETQHESFMVHGDGTIRVLEVLNTLLAYNGEGAEVVDEAVRDLNQAWAAGQITIREYANGLALLNENMPQIIANAQEATTEFEELTKAQEDAIRSADHGAARWTAMARAIDDATRSANALREISAQSEAGGVISFPSVASSAQAELTRIDTENRARQKAEAEEAARIAQDLRDEQIAAAEEARDERIRAAEAYADAEKTVASDVASIERERLAEMKAAQRDYNQEVRSLEQERVDEARATSHELRDLDEERRDLAIETEEQLRDLAEERGQVQINLAQQAQDAEREWLDTSRENLQAQAELRSELQRTTAEAAREWQQLNAENLAQQRAIQEGLRDTLQEGKTGHRREIQDISRERQRVLEDRDIALSDPNLTPEQRFQIELDAERRLEDLRVQERRAEQDFRREQKQARDEAREQEQALEEERKAAAQELGRTQREEAAETHSRIAELEAERQAAAREFAAQQAEARDAATQQLEEINQREQQLLTDQAKRFQELEQEKRIIQRDSAREQQTIAREAAHAQELLQREQAQAERQRLRDLEEAQRQFAESIAELDLTPKQAQELKLTLDRTQLDEGLADVTEDIETLDGPVLPVTADTEPAETALGELADVDTVIAVKADLTSFWRAIRNIDGDTVGTARIAVFADVEDEGASASSQSTGRSAAVGTSAFGSSVATAAAATVPRPNAPSVNNIYGPLYVTAASPDIHRELARRLSTGER